MTTDQIRAIATPILIIACLALIGAMAYFHVEGAAVAAVSSVGIVIAWLTKPPSDPPPTAAKLVPIAAIGAIIGSLFACGPAPAAPYQRAAEAAYGAALLRCVDDAKTLAESKACRARVDAEWQIAETVSKDGGR